MIVEEEATLMSTTGKCRILGRIDLNGIWRLSGLNTFGVSPPHGVRSLKFRGARLNAPSDGWPCRWICALHPGYLKLGFGGRACHPKLQESFPNEQPETQRLLLGRPRSA